jgi:hypothetical protein
VGATSITNMATTGNPVVMSNYAGSTPVGNYMQTNFGVAASTNNTGWIAFNNTGGNGSSSNYIGMGIWGLAVGTGSFNACANGNFGVCTATPSTTLDVAGSLRASSNFTVSAGTVSLPSGSVAAAALACLDAGKITTGIFTVGAFGTTNIVTTGTLGAGASTLAALTCTTITTGNNSITVGTGSIASGQHNPTTTATYDLGASGTAWRSAYLSSNLAVGGAITGSNGLTITGTVSLPLSSITNTNISCVDAGKITTGIFGVGNFGANDISTTGKVTAGSTALVSSATTNTVVSTTYAASLTSGNYIISPYGVSGSANNGDFTGFNYTNGAGSSNNYFAFGVWGYTIGSQSFNACANGNFGVCTTTPSYTLDVSGTLWASSNFAVSGGTVTLSSGSVAATAIASLDAAKITTGTFGTTLIPNLNAGKITTGSFGTALIPNLDAVKITMGVFSVGTHSVNVSASNSTSASLGLLSGATTNNAQFGLAGGAGNYSTDAAIGDAVLRNNGGNLLLQVGANASAICINSTSNYVGIGTKSPQCPLDVAGPVNSSSAFNAATTGGLIASVTNIGTGIAKSLGSFALTKALTGGSGPLDTSNVHNYACLSNVFSGGTISSYNLNISEFINIPAAATYTFSTVGCDDSIMVNIDCSQVLSSGLGLNGAVASSTTTFASAGWKNISIVNENTGGN